MSRWRRYVAFWNETEAPDALALLRITYGLAMFANVLEQIVLGDVLEFYAEVPYGGIFGFEFNTLRYSLFQYVPMTAEWVWSLVILQLLAALTLTLGLFSRLSAFLVFILQVTFFDRMVMFRFSSDEVYRVAAYLMLIAPVGAAWSLDAAFRGKGKSEIGKWARRLFMVQLAIIYTRTGIVKLGSSWSMMDDWSAVYLSVNLPGIARWNGDWAAKVYPLTQLGTFIFSWWEVTFFLLPINQYLRQKTEHERWLGRALARFDLRWIYLPLGLCMHGGILLTMNIGLFSVVMWSLYPAYFQPHEARAILGKFAVFFRPSRSLTTRPG
jgi:hypothetical protein